jgi:uncharacterized iron-regulated protein
MTVNDEIPETDETWQFTEPAPQGGGGLLKTILNEVTGMRQGAENDRVALADALTASFAKIEVEIEVLREQLATLRADLDASGTAMTNAFNEMMKAARSNSDVDLQAIVERVVAAQGHANVEAVIEALTPQLTAVRKAVPTAETARIAMEISRLRHSLIGPDPR